MANKEGEEMKKLIDLRSELSVPKGQWNKFSEFYYRSCEDILEAVKPLLSKYQLMLNITDELVNIGDRYYIKATVTISDGDKSITAVGYAREALNKKGMDEAQITGSVSSYARKYALNAMFLIDDTKDADTDEQHKQTNKPEKKASEKKEKQFIRQKAIDYITDYMQVNGLSMKTRDQVKIDFEHAKTRKDFDVILANLKGGQ